MPLRATVRRNDASDAAPFLHDIRRRSSIDPAVLFRRKSSSVYGELGQFKPLDRPFASQTFLDPEPDAARSGSQYSVERLSWAGERPPSPPIQPGNRKTHAFRAMRFRHASDPQLSTKAREQAADKPATAPPLPPMLAAPAIITTAPTISEIEPPTVKKRRFPGLGRNKGSSDVSVNEMASSRPSSSSRTSRKSGDLIGRRSLFGSKRNTSTENASSSSPKKTGAAENTQSGRSSASAVNHCEQDPTRLSVTAARSGAATPDRSSAEATRVAPPRLPPLPTASTSSRSPERQSQTASRPSSNSNSNAKSVSKRNTQTPASSIFRLPRRSKARASLFPLPVKLPPPGQLPNTAPTTPRASTGALPTPSPEPSPRTSSPPVTAIFTGSTGNLSSKGRDVGSGDATFGSHAALAASSVTFAAPGTPLIRNDSTASAHSIRSSPPGAGPMRLGARGRSSTLGSDANTPDETGPLTPPFSTSGRNSTSTAGRSSLSTFFARSTRLRHNSDSPRHGSPSRGVLSGSTVGSHTNSLSISREALVIPVREEGETPGQYLERLEETCPRHMVAGVLAKTNDAFQLNALRSFMRKFPFFGDPLDISIRKLLMESELPPEAQHIDRVLEAFANRYQECNPGIFPSPDSTHFIAFSLMVLHTDFFNSNNKRKMQKHEYIKNSKRDNVHDCSEGVLGYFYDNIVYTPFISFWEEDDLKYSSARKRKKTKLKGAVADQVKRANKEPIDPYEVIMQSNMEHLRPSLKNTMNLDDPYSWHGTVKDLDMAKLHRTFCNFGIIQIVSSRSRPEAFMNQTTIDNPQEARAGVVEIPVTKVGIVWRKEAKKRAGRPSWVEWGVILTSAGLSFFRNTAWIKSLMSQYESHAKTTSDTPVVFKPALETFKSDLTVTLGGAVALLDDSYKRHKHSVLLCSRTAPYEVFLARDDAEMADWTLKINYAATFQTVGIRPRGLAANGPTTTSMEASRERKASTVTTGSINSVMTTETSTAGEKLDAEHRRQLFLARRELIGRKVAEIEDAIVAATDSVEVQLRDARHLQILCPLQPKTREEIVHAASISSAQIKWSRIDICRMKCHRELMLLDADEEMRTVFDAPSRAKPLSSIIDSASASRPQLNKPGGLARLNSKASSVLGSMHKTAPSPTSQRLATRGLSQTDSSDDTQRLHPGTNFQRPNSWELPPLDLGPESVRRGSLANILSSPQLQLAEEHKVSIPDGREEVTSSIATQPVIAEADEEEGDDEEENNAAYVTPPNENEDDDEEEEETIRVLLTTKTPPRPIGEPAPLRSPPPAPGSTEGDVESMSDLEGGARPDSPDSKSKARHNLQKTLRDARDLASPPRGHHRGKRHNQSVSSAGTATTETPVKAGADEAHSPTDSIDTEVLSRHKKVFTVHGKKASVIKFGSEWQNMSAEDRLKVRKQAASSGGTSFAVGSAGASDKIFIGAASEDGGSMSGDGEKMRRVSRNNANLFLSPDSSLTAFNTQEGGPDKRISMASSSSTTASSFKDAQTGSPVDRDHSFPNIVSTGGAKTESLASRRNSVRSLRKSASLPDDSTWRSKGPGAFPTEDDDEEDQTQSSRASSGRALRLGVANRDFTDEEEEETEGRGTTIVPSPRPQAVSAQ